MTAWFMYVVETATGSFYCGITKDVNRRIETHNRGRGAKYLRGSRLPVRLLTTWHFDQETAHSDALKAECWFKRQSKINKINIVHYQERHGNRWRPKIPRS
jgi:putative endonuclease